MLIDWFTVVAQIVNFLVLVALLKRFDPKVFYSVDDIQSAEAGIFPLSRSRARGLLPSFFNLQRAG